MGNKKQKFKVKDGLWDSFRLISVGQGESVAG